MKTLLTLLLAITAQAEPPAKHAKEKPTKLISTRHQEAVPGSGICPCPESKPLKPEDAKKSLSYFQENKPYNSFDLSKDISSAQATKHFSELPGQKGRGIVALNTPAELNACLEEGDVLVYFRTSNDVPSANNLQGHIQEGTTHAAIVMKDKEGKFYHLDSPPGYGGQYNFSGPFHVVKLRKNQLYGDKKPEAVLNRVKELAQKMQGVSYDSSLTTDVYVEGKKLAGAKSKLPEIMRKGCEAVCSKVEGGQCPPMYCSELVYTLYALAGVEGLEAEGLSALVKRLEEDVFKGLPEGEKGLMRQRFVDTMFNDRALRAVMPEAQRTSARTLVETLMNPQTPQFVRDAVDAARGPIFFPHSFIREARKDDGAFCYAGSYLGGAFGSGGAQQAGRGQRAVQPSANLYLTLQGHTGPVNSAEFSPDGKSVLTASDDTTAKVWDAQTGELKATLSAHLNAVSSAHFSPDSSLVVTSSADFTAKIWDAQTGTLKPTLRHIGAVQSAQFSPDGKSIVTVSSDQTAKLWNTETGELKATLMGHDGRVNSAQFSPKGGLIVTGSFDGTAKLWDAPSGGLKATLQGHANSLWSARVSPDGRSIATASEDKTAKIWDSVTGKLKTRLEGHRGAVWSARFSPDGKSVLTASEDHSAKFWEVQTGALKATLPMSEMVLSGEFSPDGNSVVIASLNKTAEIWSTQTGASITTLRGHASGIDSAQFSPDGKSIVTASRDNTAKLWVAGASVTERATDFMSRLYATGPENTDAALAALTAHNNQTDWKNLVTAMKNHAGMSKDAVHTLVNNQVSAVAMQEALKTVVDTFY